MITINIPGYGKLRLEHLVMDYNGTLAIDGNLIYGLKPLLSSLSGELKLHIITADTFGTVQKSIEGIDCQLKILKQDDQQLEKAGFIKDLDKNTVVAIGNGLNDSLMLKDTALGIALIQKEGASTRTIMNSDIICTNIIDALELLLNPKRIIATLRK